MDAGTTSHGIGSTPSEEMVGRLGYLAYHTHARTLSIVAELAEDTRQVAAEAKATAARRDRLIRKTYEAGGVTVRTIADAAGLSQMQVSQIVRGTR